MHSDMPDLCPFHARLYQNLRFREKNENRYGGIVGKARTHFHFKIRENA